MIRSSPLHPGVERVGLIRFKLHDVELDSDYKDNGVFRVRVTDSRGGSWEIERPAGIWETRECLRDQSAAAFSEPLPTPGNWAHFGGPSIARQGELQHYFGKLLQILETERFRKREPKPFSYSQALHHLLRA